MFYVFLLFWNHFLFGQKNRTENIIEAAEIKSDVDSVSNEEQAQIDK